jgi:hypothetical protein
MPSRTERLEAKFTELEQRIALLEKIQSEGIDHLITEIQRLSENDGVLGEVAEQHDNLLAALRALLDEKKVVSDAEVTAKTQEISDLRERAQKSRDQEAELRQVAFRAEEAAKEEAGHPKEAFIFGS